LLYCCGLVLDTLGLTMRVRQGSTYSLVYTVF